jgi:hypothetical protein
MHGFRLRIALALVAAVACATALIVVVAGGGDSHVKRSSSAGVLSQPQIQRLSCRDWSRADVVQQAQILTGLRGILGGPVVGHGASGQGSVLRNEQARRLFDGYCAERFARDFNLYKLYGQAAGFAGRP